MKKTIVCFGDSNTHGYNSRSGGRFSDTQRYPRLLEQYLGNHYLVIEEGLSGRTTVFEDPLNEGLSGIAAIYSCLFSHEPVDLLIIMLGTNDTKARFSCNALNIAKGMERLIRKAQSLHDAFTNGVPNILILAPPPIEKGYENTHILNEMGEGCAEKSQKLAAGYKEAAALTNCHFLDAASITGIGMYPEDFMHFSVESHDLLARKLAELIPEIIG